MKKFTKNKKSREILQLHVEFLQSFLTARTENDETLMGFLENLAREELLELVDKTPERTVNAGKATEILRSYRRYKYNAQKRQEATVEAGNA